MWWLTVGTAVPGHGPVRAGEDIPQLGSREGRRLCWARETRGSLLIVLIVPGGGEEGRGEGKAGGQGRGEEGGPTGLGMQAWHSPCLPWSSVLGASTQQRFAAHPLCVVTKEQLIFTEYLLGDTAVDPGNLLSTPRASCALAGQLQNSVLQPL